MTKLEMLFAVGTLGLVVACGGGDKAKVRKAAGRDAGASSASASDAAAGSAAPAPGGRGAMAGCDDYAKIVDTFGKCESVPRDARDAAKQTEGGVERAAAAAKSDEACKQAADALAESAKAVGCAM